MGETRPATGCDLTSDKGTSRAAGGAYPNDLSGVCVEGSLSALGRHLFRRVYLR
jgi:hypothetical protein